MQTPVRLLVIFFRSTIFRGTSSTNPFTPVAQVVQRRRQRCFFSPSFLLALLALFFAVAAQAQWVQTGSDIDGEAAGDNAGYSVSLSGNGSRIVVGARNNDDAGANAGQARVHAYNGSAWVQLGVDLDGAAAGDLFGYAVAISADGARIAVGGVLNDAGGADAGHVRVFEYNGSAWVQVGSDIVGEAPGDESGRSVALSSDGSTVAIGAIWNDGGGNGSGHVRVYHFNGTFWVQTGGDINGEAAGDNAGFSVALSADGTKVAVGAYQNDGNGGNAGQARVYQYNGSAWVQLGADINGESGGDSFGTSVSLSSDGMRLAVGADQNGGGGTNAGHVRVFQYTGSAWVQIGADLDGEAAGDEFGYSVSLSSDGAKLAVGARRNDGNGSNAGQVRVFQNYGSAWTQIFADIDGEAAGDETGNSVSLSSDGSKVAMGAQANGGNGAEAGQARVFGNNGVPGAALNFDGINDYISTPNNTTLDLSIQTVEFWVKPVGSGDNDLLVGKRNYNGLNSNDTRWSIHFQNGNQGLYFYSPAGTAVWTYTFTPNQWYHIAMVTDATSTKLYIDGTFISSKATTINSPTNLPLIFGASALNFEVFPGSLDELRIWNTARSCEQINQLRNCELTGSESGLVAYYKFNQGFAGENNSGVTTLTDATSGNLHGTLSGFALTGPTSNWVTPGGVVTGTSCPAVVTPEANLQGGSPLATINDGDNTPSTTDGTDFGNVLVNGSLQRSFTIQNTGTANLTVSSIASNNGRFTVGALTPAGPIAGGGSATFTVTFNPLAAGTQNATITINNDDCSEAAYDFAVTGTGALPGAALNLDGTNDYVGVNYNLNQSSLTLEAWVKPTSSARMYVICNDNDGNYGAGFGVNNYQLEIDCHNTFINVPGTLFSNGTWAHVAVVYQSDARVRAYVNGTEVYNAIPNASWTASMNGLTSFSLGRHNPFNTLYYNGSIDEVRVWSRSLCQPEIQAQRTCELTGSESGLAVYFKFNQGIANTGNAGLTTLNDLAGTAQNGTLTNFALSGSTSNWTEPGGVASGTSCTPYQEPEINVQGGLPLATIVDGSITPSTVDSTDFGLVAVNGSRARTFTIFNTGNTALSITSITSDNAKFVVSGAPASVAAGSSATFTVTFTPTALGVQNATITINNNDCDEAVYNFAVTGTGVCVPPSFSACPAAPLTANTVTGTCAAPVSYTVTEAGNPAPTLTYAFTGATTGSGTGTGTGSTFNKGNTIVTVTATSSCSPPATCTFTVTVTDNEKPQITCADPVTINTTPSRCTGTTTLTAPTATDNCSGVFSNALHFDGTDDYISAGNVTQLSGATKLTLESWIYPTNGSTGMVMGKGTTTSANAINIERNGQTLYFRVCGAGDSYGFVNNVLPTNTWTHIACVYDGTLTGNANRLKIYINGVLQTLSFAGVSIPASAPSSTAPLTVGAFNSSTLPLGASLDEVRIWNTARTQAEIQANMNSEISAQGGLAVLYHFNQGVAYANNAAVTTATDASGNGYTGTLNGFGLNGATSNWIAFSPTLSNDAPATFPKGITTVTWTARDAAGNTQTCQQTVTVIDNQAPTLANPGNQALNTIATTCAANYTIADPVSDNCTGATWGYTLSGATTGSASGIADGTGSSVLSFNKGLTTVVLSATDGTNTATTVSFTVTVTDNEKPQITCAAPVTINTSAGLCTGTTVLTAPTVTDNCPFGGNGLNFDGNDDQLATAAYSGTALTGDLTLECWFKGSSLNGRTLLGRGFQQEFDLTLWNNQLDYYHGNGSTWVDLIFSYTFSNNTWYHVAVVRNASAQTVSLYVNGVFQQTLTYGTPLPVAQTAAFRIGHRAAGQFFSGSMDEVRVWTVARTPAQIAGNWNKELAAQPDLFALYHLNEGVANAGNSGATTAADASGNAKDGTLTNFALSGTSSNWVIGAFGGVTNNAPATYPQGATTVTWTVTDAAGNTQTCQQTVTVTDNQPPTVSCPSNLTVTPTLSSPCSAVVNGIDGVYGDNCSAALSYTLGGATTGSGNGQATGQSFLQGLTTVTYKATDAANLSSTCTFTVSVSNCNLNFSGTIKWDQDGVTGVKDATVNLTGPSPGSNTTNMNGDFLISVPYATGAFTVKPTKNINKTNGLNANDALAIQQYLATQFPITNPLKLIAADVNKSNTISNLDATIITQSLLGNPAALNQFKSSWRFVPNSALPLSIPPWGFPEEINLSGVNASQSGLNFTGIKIGDLVGSPLANPANLGALPAWVLHVPDEAISAGDTLDILFRAEALDDLSAFQMALYFDPEALGFVSVTPTESFPLIPSEHVGLYTVDQGEIRVVWSQTTALSPAANTPLFRLRLKALKSALPLRDLLRLDPDVLLAQAYNSKLEERPLELAFDQTTTTGDAGTAPYRLLQNRPNPFSEATTIGFVLPEECEIRLRIFDLTGRELWRTDRKANAGYNEENILLDGAAASGVLYYELNTPYGLLARRMVYTRR